MKFIQSVLESICSNSSKKNIIISIPEFYDFSLIINLFNKMLFSLRNVKDSDQSAFSKNKNSKKSESPEDAMINFMKKRFVELGVMNVNQLDKSTINFEIRNTASVLGKQKNQ